MASPWPALMGYSRILQNTLFLLVPWQSCGTWLLILCLKTHLLSPFLLFYPRLCGLCGEDIDTHHIWLLLTQMFLEIHSNIFRHQCIFETFNPVVFYRFTKACLASNYCAGRWTGPRPSSPALTITALCYTILCLNKSCSCSKEPLKSRGAILISAAYLFLLPSMIVI